MMKRLIGALAKIVFTDEPLAQHHRYISFSEEVFEGEDQFGIDDDNIFFYCPNGEEEIIGLMNPDSGEDFTVLSYELEWQEI